MAGKRKKKDQAPEGVVVLIRNRKALHDYAIEERLEAGISLTGSEVKSLRDKHASIGEGFVTIRNGEAWLIGVQIEEYPFANQLNHEPTRERRLLLHRREIDKLDVRVHQRGYSLVPLSVYVKDGRIKLEIGVGRGKRQYEKRHTLREADAKREMEAGARRR